MKKLISILMMITLLLTSLTFAQAPELEATSAVLISSNNGIDVLYDKNAHTPLPPASTTKILTALIILENHQLDERVVVPLSYQLPAGAKISVRREEDFSLKDLVYGLLIESANDAAEILAIYHSGSVEAFAEEMNTRALELGALNSTFKNPHGLDQEGHLSTAYDLAVIAATAMQHPTFKDIVITPRYTIEPTNKSDEVRNWLKTSNFLVRDVGANMMYQGKKIPVYDPNIEGIKTGYTSNAGNCLVSSLSHNGTRYISVVLDSNADNSVFSDSKALLYYGKENFESKRLVPSGEVVKSVTVPGTQGSELDLITASPISHIVEGEVDPNAFTRQIDLYDLPEGNIDAGTELGVLTLLQGEKVIGQTKLIAQRDIVAGDLIGNITYALSTKSLFSSPFEIFLLAGKLLLTLWIWRSITLSMRRKKRRKERLLKREALRQEAIRKQESNVYDLREERKKRM